MASPQNTILLIADISGYTRFMKQHSVSLSHAKQIIVRLLKALMAASRPPLKVAELEGDAVFFYARADKHDIDKVAAQVKEQVVHLLAAFKKELGEIDSLRTCSCDACDHVHDLQLKQVIHAGDVQVEKIGRFEKLFGLDVILIHRMLKNSVAANEYVMMTHPMYTTMKDFYGLPPELRKEVFEGVGEVETFTFYPHNIHADALPARQINASAMKKLLWRIGITANSFRDVFGFEPYKGTFQNLPT